MNNGMEKRVVGLFNGTATSVRALPHYKMKICPKGSVRPYQRMDKRRRVFIKWNGNFGKSIATLKNKNLS